LQTTVHYHFSLNHAKRWSSGASDSSGSLQQLLKLVETGELSAKDALQPIQALLVTSGFEKVDMFAHVDHNRAARTGLPEVVYAEGKTAAQVVAIVQSLLAKQDVTHDGSAVILATRVSPTLFEEMQSVQPDLSVTYNATARVCVYNQTKDSTSQERSCGALRGDVVVVCAGTTDIPVAEEAAVTLRSFGASVRSLNDVGVAGLHRLLGNLDMIRSADVVICVAGMDGALPSVVGGLIDAPVIAVPTSVGYGAAFGGISAMLTMLNSCASGVCVMNIDNGFGAAMVAAKILRKINPAPQ